MFAQIAPGIRVEATAPRKRVKATPETLSNAVTPVRYQIGKHGSDGLPIVDGESFEYLDDSAPKVWQVYQEHEVEEILRGEPVTRLRYLPMGDPHETEEAAHQAATALIESV